jgi:hypothetical protein
MGTPEPLINLLFLARRPRTGVLRGESAGHRRGHDYDLPLILRGIAEPPDRDRVLASLGLTLGVLLLLADEPVVFASTTTAMGFAPNGTEDNASAARW